MNHITFMTLGMKHILNNLVSMKLRFAIYAFLGVVSELLILYLPQVTKKLVDAIETLKDREVLMQEGKQGVLIVVCFMIFDFAYIIFGEYLWSYLFVSKEKEYREKYLATNYQLIEKVGTGKMQTRVNRGINAETNITFSYRNIFLSTFIRGFALLGVFFMNEPRLAYMLLGLLIFVIGVNHIMKKKISVLSKKLHDLYEESNRDFVRMAMHHLLIVISGKQQHELDKSASKLDQYPKLEGKTAIWQELPYNILHLCMRILEIVVYVLVGLLVIKGESTLAQTAMYVFYLWLFWNPISKALENLGKINRNREHANKLLDFFAQEKPIQDGKEQFVYKNGTIALQHVAFGYDAQQQLFSDLSVTIQGGKKTALVGVSGGGKSTLMKLLLRIYDPQKGMIKVDGQDLRTLQLGTYYKHIGYLTQEPSVFDGTVYENLTYDSEGAVDKNELKRVIKLAKCSFIYDLKDGLQTEIGERGIHLSGGQRQRIAIAKIFLRKPEIIFLDEPTSSLDSSSEEAITDALNNLFEGRTVVVIAHRLQTVKEADDIIVLNKGKIIERGTHNELIEQGGAYAKMLELQSGF